MVVVKGPSRTQWWYLEAHHKEPLATGPCRPWCDQPGSRPALANADVGGLGEAGGLGGLGDVAWLDVAGAAGLGREDPDDTAVGERRDRVDERVDQIAVVVAPPEQHGVHHVVGVLVEQLVAVAQFLDRGAKVVVDVLVPA